MQVVESISDVRRIRRGLPGSWGLVPTMGFLHAGIWRWPNAPAPRMTMLARRSSSIPRSWANRRPGRPTPAICRVILALLEVAGVDLVWTPPVDEIYPSGFQSYVTVEAITKVWQGVARPTHFRGVSTVVAKLFNVFQPDRAYFGQKDAQQVVVIQRMVHDLNFPLEIVVCPTVREADGLALSSRNTYLTPEQRAAAPVLYRALCARARCVADVASTTASACARSCAPSWLPSRWRAPTT